MKVYLNASAQISIQEPLSEAWFASPLIHDRRLVQAVEPDYKPFVNPMAARRMGKLLKRAIATAKSAILQAGNPTIDAVITGTGLGCIANTEHFLSAMVKEGEEFLQPTYFMQSTHNTVSSQIALQLVCRGYNNTYTQLGASFESALLDAFMLVNNGHCQHVLVGGHDEMTPDYFNMLDKARFWKKGEVNTEVLRQADTEGSFAGETAASFVLSAQKQRETICCLAAVDMLYRPTMERLQNDVNQMLSANGLCADDVDLVMIGANGDSRYDGQYHQFCSQLFAGKSVAWYKHLFGESYTSAALGLHAAAACMRNQSVPDFLLYNAQKVEKVRNILIYNHYQNKEHSLILVTNG